jgi:hypothetical protein
VLINLRKTERRLARPLRYARLRRRQQASINDQNYQVSGYQQGPLTMLWSDPGHTFSVAPGISTLK